jgi:hypothetical protein
VATGAQLASRCPAHTEGPARSAETGCKLADAGARVCRQFQYGDVYCAFNAHRGNVVVHLPPAPKGHHWCRLADTNLPAPRDWVDGGNKGVENEYTITGKSSIMLISKPQDPSSNGA